MLISAAPSCWAIISVSRAVTPVRSAPAMWSTRRSGCSVLVMGPLNMLGRLCAATICKTSSALALGPHVPESSRLVLQRMTRVFRRDSGRSAALGLLLCGLLWGAPALGQGVAGGAPSSGAGVPPAPPAPHPPAAPPAAAAAPGP